MGSQIDWIERLRESKFRVANIAPRGVMIPEALWPLLCDVVEAATEAESILEAVAGPQAARTKLRKPLAALRAEVEKDA